MNESLSGTSTVTVTSAASWVSVAEILAHRVPVHGSEAIAVLAELCAVLVAQGEEAIPHAADILLNGDGALSIRGPHGGESDCTALGRMLHDLLDTAQIAVPLRLFVSQTISAERYQSVQAFAEGLASFEVPGRHQLIQAVHKRFVAMPTATAPSFLPKPALPQTEPSEQSVKPNAHRRLLPRWAIASVSVVVLVGGAATAWRAAGAHPGVSTERLTAFLRRSVSSVSSSVPAVIRDALPWLTVGKPTDTTAAEAETRVTKRARAARSGTAAAQVRAGSPAVDESVASGVTDTTASVTDTISASGSATFPVATDDGTAWTARIVSETPVLTALAASTPSAATGETPLPLDDAAQLAAPVVYSSAFPEVKPPVMLTPHMTAQALSRESPAANTMELVIDEFGRVERVRLVSQPSRILAMMLLSAAKTWQFRPALNEGRPVKYRLLLDVLTPPR